MGFLNKLWSGADFWDKEENARQRQQFAQTKATPRQRAAPVQTRRSAAPFSNQVASQVNQGLDRGLSWEDISRNTGINLNSVRSFSRMTRPEYGIKAPETVEEKVRNAKYGVLARSENAQNQFLKSTEASRLNPLTATLGSARDAAVSVPKAVVKGAWETADVPVKLAQRDWQGAVDSADQSLLGGAKRFGQSVTSAGLSPISNRLADQERKRAERLLTPAYENLYQAYGYKPGMGAIQAGVESGQADYNLRTDPLTRSGVSPNDSTATLFRKVGAQGAEAGLDILTAPTTALATGQAAKSALKTGANQFLKTTASSSLLSAAGNLAYVGQMDGATTGDYIKAGVGGAFVGAALPVTTNLATKAVRKSLVNAKLAPAFRGAPEELLAVQRVQNQRAGWGNVASEADFAIARNALAKNGVSIDDVSAIDRMLGDQRTYETRVAQRKQTATEAVERVKNPVPLNEGGYRKVTPLEQKLANPLESLKQEAKRFGYDKGYTEEGQIANTIDELMKEQNAVREVGIPLYDKYKDKLDGTKTITEMMTPAELKAYRAAEAKSEKASKLLKDYFDYKKGQTQSTADPLESLKQEASSVSKFGWGAEATPQGTKLFNRNGKHVATITQKNGRFTASYADGQRIATGADANKLAEDVARKTFYAQELPQNTGGTLRPDKTPEPFKNTVQQGVISPERANATQSRVDSMKSAMEFDKVPTPKKAFHSTSSLEIEGGKLRTSPDGAMGEGVYLHTDQNTAKYAGAMQSDGNIADQTALDINLKTDNLYKWADQEYPTSKQIALIKKRGYDGIYKKGGEIVVFDPNKVEINQATAPKTDPLDALKQEARKYKSAEEFIDKTWNRGLPTDETTKFLDNTPEAMAWYKILDEKKASEPIARKALADMETLRAKYIGKKNLKLTDAEKKSIDKQYNELAKTVQNHLDDFGGFDTKTGYVDGKGLLIESSTFNGADNAVKQLTDLYNQALKESQPKAKNTIPPEVEPEVMYRGESPNRWGKGMAERGEGLYLGSKRLAGLQKDGTVLNDGIHSYKINPKAKLLQEGAAGSEYSKLRNQAYKEAGTKGVNKRFTELVREAGYDGVRSKEEIVVMNPSVILESSPGAPQFRATQPTKGAVPEPKDIKTRTIKTKDGKTEYVAQLGNIQRDRVGREAGFKATATSPNFRSEGEMQKWISKSVDETSTGRGANPKDTSTPGKVPESVRQQPQTTLDSAESISGRQTPQQLQEGLPPQTKTSSNSSRASSSAADYTTKPLSDKEWGSMLKEADEFNAVAGAAGTKNSNRLVEAINTDNKITRAAREAQQSGREMHFYAAKDKNGRSIGIQQFDPRTHRIEAGFVVDQNGRAVGNHIKVDQSGIQVNVGGDLVNMGKIVGDTSQWRGKYRVTETMSRNIDRLAPNKEVAQRTKDFLIGHKVKAEANYRTELEGEYKKLGDRIKSVESTRPRGVSKDQFKADIFDLLDGKKTDAEIRSSYGKPTADAILSYKNETKQLYSTLLDRVNSERIKFGMEPVQARKDYITHLQELNGSKSFVGEVKNTIRNSFTDEGQQTTRNGIPGNIAGRSEGFEPRTAYNKFMQRRTGDKAVKDPFRAVQEYLEPALYNIHMTESTVRARAIETAFRTASELQQMKGGDVLNETKGLLSKYQAGDNAKLVTGFQEYANTLAKKTNRFDRPLIDASDATARGLKEWQRLQRIGGRATILGNVSSTLAQPLNQVITLADAGPKNYIKGIIANIGGDKAIEQSDFIKARQTKAVAPIRGRSQKVLDAGGVPLELVEMASVKNTWHSMYAKAKSSGLTGAEAIKRADYDTERLVAGRGIADRPEIYRSTVASGLLQYTLEVSAQNKAFWQDLSVPQKATFLASAMAMNTVYGAVTGYEPLPDFLGATLETGGDLLDEKDDRTAGEKLLGGGQRLAAEAVSMNPVYSGLANNLLSQDARKTVFGSDSDLGRYPGTAAPVQVLQNVYRAGKSAADGNMKDARNSALKVVPFGNQARKTITGAEANANGYAVDRNGKKTFETGDTLASQAKNLLFGPSSTAGDYFNEKYGTGKLGKPSSQKNSGTAVRSVDDAVDGIKSSYGGKFAELTQDELKEAAKTDTDAKDYMNKLAAAKKAGEEPDDLPNSLGTKAKDVLTGYNRLTTEGKKNWGNRKADKEVTKTINSWLPKNVEKPPITNETAKDWAYFEKRKAEGTIGKLEEIDERKKILRAAYNSQLNEDERDLYRLSKARLQAAYESGLINDSNINKALAVEKQLFDAGLIDKETLRKKLGLSARGYKGSSGRGGRGGKKGGKYDWTKNMFASGSEGSGSVSKKLRQIIESAQKV